MPFQSLVYETAGVGVPGDFSDHGPRVSYPAGPGGLQAGPAGVTVGNFAWVSSLYQDFDNAPATVNSFGYGAPAGIVANEFQTTLTTFLAETTLIIKPGYGMGLYSYAGFWVKNAGTTTAIPGMSAYANFSTGAINFAAASAPLNVTAATSSIAAASFSATGSIIGATMFVTAVGSGTIYAGATISGANVVTGTVVTGQLSGVTGSTGTYSVSIGEQSVASTTITGAYGVLTLGATPSGAFGTGMQLSGTNVVTTGVGTYVGQLLTGSPTVSGATFVVNNASVVGSTTITAASNIQTKWIAYSQGVAGELVKVSSWLPG